MDEFDMTKKEVRKFKDYKRGITRGLSEFFGTVAAEPIPDEFAQLLQRLDEDDNLDENK